MLLHSAFRLGVIASATLLLVSCGDPVADASPQEAEQQPNNPEQTEEPLTKADKEMENPMVVLATTRGDIVLELYQKKAPVTVENFLTYVKNGFYDGTIFHRVIPNFMIQGGGFTEDMAQKTTRATIKNEADNGLKNLRGTIAMARTQAVDSASSQFFISVKDNASLDHSERNFGYAVFGEVKSGMDVVDAIVESPTTRRGMHENVPQEAAVIKSAHLKK